MTEDRAYTIRMALRNIKLSISDEMNEQLKPWFEDIEKAIEDEQTAIQSLSQEPCDKCKYFDGNSCQHYDYKVGYTQGYEDANKRFRQEPCTDAVSREAVFEIQAKYAEHMGATKFWQMSDDIKALPSVNPQPCEDAISRQAVLDIAKSSKSNWIDNSVLFKRVNELPPVTSTHKHVGSTQQNVGNALDMRCDDAISREALVDDFIEWREKLEYTVGEDYSGVHLLNVAIQKIWGMPSVTQKSGKWIKSRDCYGNHHFTCSECGNDIATQYADNWNDKYCSECGARMEIDANE